MTSLMERVRRGDLVLIDGGTGTEIQRRGVAMSEETWCADANLTAPDVVREVHRTYIDAGAELIIANTFATSPFLFDALGRIDELRTIDHAAVRLARDAARGEVSVAGSMSTMRPVHQGDDRTDMTTSWPEEAARQLCRHKADGLAEFGVDLIIMEMMRDTDYSVWATEAALATGLPVWVGLSVEPGPDGALTGWGRPDCALDDIVAAMVDRQPDLIAVMHTAPIDSTAALYAVQSRFAGPVGVYPETGHFTSPTWVFDGLGVDDLVEVTRGWVTQGATVIGGCCGTTPEHIAALRAAFGPSEES